MRSMAFWDYPKFYLDSALVECTSGPKPVCVALLNEEGSILLNCYVVPRGAVVDWRTKDTALSSFNDLLACNPVHLEQVQEYLHHFIPPESILIGHGIGTVAAAFGLTKEEDYACSIDISDWFAVQLSKTLCQTFDLSHILKVLLGDDIPGHDSGKRDPLLDAQYSRMLYHAYKDIPYEHPIMNQARQTLYEGLPKAKRLVDPALTMQLSHIPEGLTAKEIRRTIIPRQVIHLVDTVQEVQWATTAGAAGTRGSTLVVFKNASDVEQMMLRLHSNIDDWDWMVRREGQCYVHKGNAMRIEEVEDASLKVFIHSIPDDWSEGNVKKRLVPEVLHPHVLEVKPIQFNKTKDQTKRLGRTHVMFSSQWCVTEMIRLLHVMSDDWTWTTQADGSLLFAHKPDGLLAESARPLTFEQLMSAYDAPTYGEAPSPTNWKGETILEFDVEIFEEDDEEESGADDMDFSEEATSATQAADDEEVGDEKELATLMVCG